MEDVDADDIAFTWGMPLYHCAQLGLATALLDAGVRTKSCLRCYPEEEPS